MILMVLYISIFLEQPQFSFKRNKNESKKCFYYVSLWWVYKLKKLNSYLGRINLNLDFFKRLFSWWENAFFFFPLKQ
jgi:hypothetical protein